MNKFDMKEIVSVYKGKPDTCMCGCAGDYAYNPINKSYATTNRGYKVSDDECSERKIKARLKRYYADCQKPSVIENYIFTKVIGNTQITVYLKKKK